MSHRITFANIATAKNYAGDLDTDTANSITFKAFDYPWYVDFSDHFTDDGYLVVGQVQTDYNSYINWKIYADSISEVLEQIQTELAKMAEARTLNLKSF